MRATSTGLLLPELGGLTVSQTIEHVARVHRRRTGSTVDVALRDLPERAPLAAKIAIYRVIQEALNNSWRHARGASQAVRVEGRNGSVRLEVSDMGAGFDASTIGGSDAHLGLVGMRERVESLGGDFHIVSGPGQGTRIVANLPLEQTGELYG